MNRADISRAMFVGHAEYFFKVFDKPRREEYKLCSTPKKSTKDQETYETLGNMGPAEVKDEEHPVNYDGITEAYETTVINETIAKGFKVTMEASEDEQYGIVNKVKTSELARKMHLKRERAVAGVWDSYITAVGADGVAACAVNHPLLGSAKVNNNRYVASLGAPTPDRITGMSNMFNAIYDHAGEPMDTEATAIMVHRNYETLVASIYQSSSKALEQSNTKNTLPSLKLITNKYIAQLPWFLIDEMIASVIFQRRKGLTPEYDYDKRSTFNWYFNTHERYKAAFIHPGYGFVGQAGA
jgi:phage major head subunit gpT-like protein